MTSVDLSFPSIFLKCIHQTILACGYCCVGSRMLYRFICRSLSLFLSVSLSLPPPSSALPLFTFVSLPLFILLL